MSGILNQVALDATQAIRSKGKQDEHIYADSSTAIATANISKGAILISAGQNAGNGIYEYKNLITNQKVGTISLENIAAEQGLTLVDMGNGFRIAPDVSNSYGASILRTMSLSYMRAA